MPAILDAATLLLPAGQITTNTDGTPLQLYPRQLPSCAWVISMLTPPVAAATFTLQVSNLQAGSFTTIASFTWPAGTSGTKQLPLGLSGKLAQVLDNDSVWLRCSVTTAGALTLAGSWLSKASDGGPGLGSRSYAHDGINPF
jgi:hypothetical protein